MHWRKNSSLINSKLTSFESVVAVDDVSDNEIILRAGKKTYHKLRVEEE